LVPLLITKGHTVRAAVRSGQAPRRIPSAAQTICIGDLSAGTDWSMALEGVDAVIHVAGLAREPGKSGGDPEQILHAVNGEASGQLARAAARCGVRRFVFLSSIKVNGEQTTTTPFREADAPAPFDAYGRSKLVAEQLIAEAAESTSMEVVFIRPPLVYGPSVEANFRQLMNLAARAWPLPLASVDNRRSLIFVGNLVDAMATCLSHPAAAGRTFLVSDGDDVSTPELIRRLAFAMGRKSRLFPVPCRLIRRVAALIGGERQVARLLDSLQVDSSFIRDTLDWHPPFSFSEGLRITALDFTARTQ